VSDEREGHEGVEGARHGRLQEKLRAKLRAPCVGAMC
jgi:hypothetical protein